MVPQTLTEVENLVQKKLLWKLGASGMAACRRVVNDALTELDQKYSHPSQLRAYELQKGKLKHLLAALGGD